MKKTLKTSKKTDGDKEKKIRELLLQCNTPEEALLVRCSHYQLEGFSSTPILLFFFFLFF
jgi:hypothetical protein